MKFKQLIQYLLAFIPTTLPQGMTEFEIWSDNILNLYKLPNNESTKFALATMILHLPSGKSKVSKRHFGESLKKASANEIAAAVMQNLKAKQKARIEAEQQANKEKAVLEMPTSGQH